MSPRRFRQLLRDRFCALVESLVRRLISLGEGTYFNFGVSREEMIRVAAHYPNRDEKRVFAPAAAG
jgi:hypothetical protein